MKTLSIIYWSRVGLGIIAALINVLYDFFTVSIGLETSSFSRGLSFAMLLYILTHYVFKRLFMAKVEKPSKVFTTGIGAYFIVWIAAWTLFYTLTLSLLGLLPAG
ncbi:MAG: hypothetical protein ACE5OW_08305 [Candidatus Bathyarchaeia archaeon]